MNDLFGALFERQSPSASNLLNFTPLTKGQQDHLTKTYGVMATGILSAAFGVYMSLNILYIPVFLAVIAEIGCLMYISMTSGGFGAPAEQKVRHAKRLAAFFGLSFFSGVMMSELINYVSFLNPAILSMAFFATLAIFVSFSLAAMFAKQRQFLFLGSLLMSVTSYLAFVSLFNIFFRSKIGHDVVLYGGFLSFIGYVLYDTQRVICDYDRGHKDVVLHASIFYLDIAQIFVRLLRIMAQREEEKQENRRRKNN